MTYDNLVEENFALRQQLQALKLEKQLTWSTLVDVVRKLQASSASIKAAVSSLLNYDIFWDVANQHEFLLTIDASANQASDLVMLLSLASRLEAERLELKKEPHSILEILTVVEATIQRRFPEKKILLSMSPDGQVVWVDYDYLSLALVILLDVLFSNPSQTDLGIIAKEEEEYWIVELHGIDASVILVLEGICHSVDDQIAFRKEDKISSENLLKLLVFLKLINFQGVFMHLPKDEGSSNPLVIKIPTRLN